MATSDPAFRYDPPDARPGVHGGSSAADWARGFFLQLAHRGGVVAVFAWLATWAFVYQGQSYRWPLAIAFMASDLGLCAAIVATLAGRRSRHRSAEALGAMVFNLLLALLSLQWILISRLDLIRSALQKFFAAS